jgi:DnaJ-domain-containing protein 1
MVALRERPGDDTGFQTRVWGPAGWIFLHSIAQNYPWKPTEEQMGNYYTFFKSVGNVLPCRYCRESYQKFIDEKGTCLTMDTMKSRKTLFLWLYNIHNRINKKLGVKNHPTKQEVWEKYESFRAKCHKSPEKYEKPKKGCHDPMRGFRKKCVISIVNVDEQGNEFGKQPKPKPKPKKKPSKKEQQAQKEEEEILNAMRILEVSDRHDVNKIKENALRLAKVYRTGSPTANQSKYEELRDAFRLLLRLNKQPFTTMYFGKKKSYNKKTSQNQNDYIPPSVSEEDKFIKRAMETLGVNDSKDISQIKKNYRKLSMIYHPDRPTGNEEKFKEISNAYEMLMQLNGMKFGKSQGKRKNIKLISIKKSNKSGKKLMATFETNGRRKVIHFGAAGMGDYTKHHDRVRRNRYITRHLKDYRTGDPSRAGYLSMFVLWNKPSLQASISDYRRRLGVYNRTGKFPTNIAGYKK